GKRKNRQPCDEKGAKNGVVVGPCHLLFVQCCAEPFVLEGRFGTEPGYQRHAAKQHEGGNIVNLAKVPEQGFVWEILYRIQIFIPHRKDGDANRCDAGGHQQKVFPRVEPLVEHQKNTEGEKKAAEKNSGRENAGENFRLEISRRQAKVIGAVRRFETDTVKKADRQNDQRKKKRNEPHP